MNQVRRKERVPRTKQSYNRREAIAGYLFISPWIIGFLVFTAGAMIYSLYISFSNYNLATNTARPVGIDNYARLFDDPRVGVALANTLFYVVMAVPLEVIFALILAMLLAMYRESGGVPSRLGFDPVATGQGGLWILGAGGQLNDGDGAPTLDDPSNIAGIELLKQITDAQGGFAAVKSFTDSFDTFGDSNQYVSGQVGAQVNAQWYPNVLGAYADQIDIEAVPFRDANGEPFAVASGTAFVVPVGAENPAAACAWMVNLTSDDAWMAAGNARAETLETEGGLNTGLFTGSPAADQAIREEFVVETGDAGFDQVISTFYEVVDYGQSFGSSPAGQEIQNELNNAITAALLGDKSPEQALADAQQAAMRAYENATAG